VSDRLDKRVRKANLHTMERHVLVCVEHDCGGKRTAKALRKAIKAHGLGATVSVAKVDCFDICDEGAIAVVYPEGTWYARLEGDTVERVVTEHLRDGQVVEELVFHRNALGARGCADEADQADQADEAVEADR